MKANLSILVGLFCCLSLSSFKIENLHKGFSLVSQKENSPPKESFPSDPKKPSDESLFIKRRSEEKVIDISSDLENNEKEIDLETPSNNEEEKATSVLENKNGEIDQDTSKALENNEKKKASSNLKGREACIAQPCIECKSSTPLLRYIESTDAPTPAGPFSQGVIFNSSKGDLLFVAGQLPIDPKLGRHAFGSIRTLTNRTLDNIEAVLKKAGSGWDKVIRVDAFLQDMKDFKAFNEEYAKRFPGGNYPARQTIQSNIILPVEISCIAVVPYDNEEE